MYCVFCIVYNSILKYINIFPKSVNKEFIRLDTYKFLSITLFKTLGKYFYLAKKKIIAIGTLVKWTSDSSSGHESAKFKFLKWHSFWLSGAGTRQNSHLLTKFLNFCKYVWSPSSFPEFFLFLLFFTFAFRKVLLAAATDSAFFPNYILRDL